MLKAVRFDPDSHKELIEYIENYRDKRGKPNHSEAIRFLMEKGFETLNGPKQVTSIVSDPQPTIDLDKFKEQIVKEIWETIGKNAVIQNPVQTHTFTQVNYEPVNIEKQKEPITSVPPKPVVQKRTTIPAEAGSLLGNLLGNANRG